MLHGVFSLDFKSFNIQNWSTFPSSEELKKEIAVAVLAHSEVTENALGFYTPPNEINNIDISAAALDQIQCMWHGHRQRVSISPPSIPLRLFVVGFGQDSGRSWASIEVLPGLDNWNVQ